LQYVYDHGFLNVFGEALSFDFQSIVPGDELGYFIHSIGAGSSSTFGIGAEVDYLDRGAWNQAAFLITNHPSDCARI
jgi:hypothetical protein